MKQVLLSILLLASFNVIAKQITLKNISNDQNIIGRGAEIRYITNHPAEENFVVVDEKKYPVFNSKKEALTYVQNMIVKYDLTIVYVRSEIEKESEFTDIIE